MKDNKSTTTEKKTRFQNIFFIFGIVVLTIIIVVVGYGLYECHVD